MKTVPFERKQKRDRRLRLCIAQAAMFCALAHAAAEAYEYHVSQQIYTDLFVTDDPTVRFGNKYNCAHFGLYRSTVGADTGTDLAQHIVPFAEQRKIAEDAAQALLRAWRVVR